jgi:predicted DNA-binding ribbon-helix-helix protein
MEPAVKKRSVVVGGHKTSTSLENEFWEALREIAQSQQMSLSKLPAAIKAEQRQNSLSSAIRVFVLNHYRKHSRPPQLAASFILNQACDVAYWHLADIPAAPAFVRFWTKADKGGFWPVTVCPLMTHKRHWQCTAAIFLMAVSAPIKVLV